MTREKAGKKDSPDGEGVRLLALLCRKCAAKQQEPFWVGLGRSTHNSKF